MNLLFYLNLGLGWQNGNTDLKESGVHMEDGLEEVNLTKLRKIGDCVFGEVYELRDPEPNQLITRKFIRVDNKTSTATDLKRERCAVEKAYRRRAHENIVTILSHGWLPDQFFYCIDLERCDATLFNYIHDYYDPIRTVFENHDLSAFELSDDSWKLYNIWSITVQILNGLHFLHHCGQIHGDLKPGTVMYAKKDGKWKICDFETTTEVAKRSSYTTRPAVCYRAPELLDAKPTYNTKSDIWSVGCILYELITKRGAFSSASSVLECSESKMLTLPIPHGPGDGGDDLSVILASMLEIEILRRPAAKHVADEMGWKMYRWLARSLVKGERFVDAKRAYELAVKKRSRYPHLWFNVAENIQVSPTTERLQRSRSSSSATIINLSLSEDKEVELSSPADIARTRLYEFACTVLSKAPSLGAGSLLHIEEAQARSIEAIEKLILKPQNPKHSLLFWSDSPRLNLLFEGDYTNALKFGDQLLDDRPYEQLGDIYAIMGSYTEALKMYKTGLRKDPSNMSLRITLGHAYFARAVATQYNPTKDDSCGQPLLWRRNVDGDYKTEYSKAIKAYSSVGAHCGVANVECVTSKYMVQAYVALQYFDQALKTAQLAVKKHPCEWDVWDDLADTQDKAIRHHCLATFALFDPRSTSVKGEGINHRYFGVQLEDILEMENDLIPNFVRLCINAIERSFTSDPEHVYLVSGDPLEIAKLKAQWEISVKDGVYDDGALFESVDIHTCSGLLLHYLRSLPEPLISTHLYSELLKLEESHGDLKMAGAIARDEIQALLAPNTSFHLINELAEHLYALCKVTEQTDTVVRMCIKELAIIFRPIFFGRLTSYDRQKQDEISAQLEMLQTILYLLGEEFIRSKLPGCLEIIIEDSTAEEEDAEAD